MAQKYMFSVNEQGKAATGTVIDYPNEYTHEGTQEVWENQERAFYVDGQWIIYDKIALDVPTSGAADEEITATATLPADSPDSEVTFSVRYQDQEWEPITASAMDGQAQTTLEFAEVGAYQITVSSMHHGADVQEILIHETDNGVGRSI